MTQKLELRHTQRPLEMRNDEGKRPMVRGYAIVWDVLSSDLGGFRERIARSAVDGMLDGDVHALRDHDWGKVLGRTTAGDLRLTADRTGLAIELDIDTETSYGRDTFADVKGKRVTGMSFGFKVPPGGGAEWTEDKDQGIVRTVTKFMEFPEVTITARPAYTQTSVNARDLETARAIARGDVPRGEGLINDLILRSLDR